MPVFKLSEVPQQSVDPKQSVSLQAVVKGEQIEAVRRTFPATKGANPHTHPNEQIVMVLSGKARITIDGETHEVGAGDAWLVPAGALHELRVIEDLKIITCKNLVGGKGHRLGA